MQIGSGTRDADVEHIVGDVEDHRLKEESRSCQRFLVDSELERARHRVFNYTIENVNAQIVDEIFDHIFNNSKCAAKVNLDFGFIEKYRRWRVHIFLRTRNQYPAGSIQTCVHQGRLGKAKRFSQQN